MKQIQAKREIPMNDGQKSAVSGQQKTHKLLNQNSKMQELLSKSAVLVRNLKETFVRSLSERVAWSDRLIGIIGARGL